MMSRGFWVALAALALAVPLPAAEDEVTRAIASIKGVGREGANNESAGPAWKTLVGAGASALFPALSAIDDADPRASNWLRAGVVAVAEAEAKAGRSLPADKLEAFTKDTKNAPSARKLAYDLLVKQEPAVKDKLLPGFLNDPHPDLRRDAVAAGLKGVDALSRTAAAKAKLDELFAVSRDLDQVEEIAKKLEADHKAKPGVTEHFAFVTRWHVVGPFPSERGKALTTAHPPETNPDVTAKYPGTRDAKLAWKPLSTAHKLGTLDLNKTVGVHKNAAVYALATIVAEKETPCDVRATSPNAVQIWLNGTKVFEREEYHHGEQLDYHTGKAVLKAGKNTLLVKVAQNNQKESWAQLWQFAARFSDPTGGKLPGLTQLDADGKPLPLGHNPEPAPEPVEEKK